MLSPKLRLAAILAFALAAYALTQSRTKCERCAVIHLMEQTAAAER